eukprot:6214396-Pleurochrysis_carterae.AAC.1
MDANIWGPTAWAVLLCVAKYSSIHLVYQIIDLYQKALPCGHCRSSFHAMCSTSLSPRTCKTNDELLLWVYTMHHLVNLKLQKKASPALHVVDARLSVFDSVSCVDIMTLLVCMGESAIAAGNASAVHSLVKTLPVIRELFLSNKHICGGRKVADILRPTAFTSGADLLKYLHAARIQMYQTLDMETPSDNLRGTIARISSKAKTTQHNEEKRNVTESEMGEKHESRPISFRRKRRGGNAITQAYPR